MVRLLPSPAVGEIKNMVGKSPIRAVVRTA